MTSLISVPKLLVFRGAHVGHRNVTTALFVAAVLIRYTAFVRGDYSAWWDGGTPFPGYADLWISNATHLAFEGTPRGLRFSYEGLLYTICMAPFLKAFGLYGGLVIWSHVLILSSALIAPIAMATIRAVGGHVAGAALVGILVAFDPVLAWYGLNGWSDSATMFAAALAFLLFIRAAQHPSHLKLVCFGMTLAILALDHATWTWPALAWALVCIPFMYKAPRWLPAPVQASHLNRSHRSIRRTLLPLIVLIASLSLANIGLLAIGSADPGNVFPVLTSDSGNQRRLAMYYDGNLEWDAWRPSDTARTIATKFPAVAPQQISTLVRQQIGPAIPFVTWLLVANGLALAVIATSSHKHRSVNVLGLAGFLLATVIAWRIDLTSDPVAAGLMLVLGLAWVYSPTARTILLVSMPILGIIVLWTGTITGLRHSSMGSYVLYLISGILVGEAGRIWATTSVPRRLTWARIAAGRTVGVLTAASIVFGISQFFGAFQSRANLEGYTKWLDTVLPPNAVIMTKGNVDPWHVASQLDRDVIYDVENGARLVLDSSNTRWGQRLSKVYPDAPTNADLIRSIQAGGREIFWYTPDVSKLALSFSPRFVSEDTYPKYELRATQTSSQNKKWAVVIVKPSR
jgi:hypothetical protein